MVMSWIFGLTILLFVCVKLAQIRMKVRQFFGAGEGSGSPTPHSSTDETLAVMYTADVMRRHSEAAKQTPEGGPHASPSTS